MVGPFSFGPESANTNLAQGVHGFEQACLPAAPMLVIEGLRNTRLPALGLSGKGSGFSQLWWHGLSFEVR